MVIVTLILAIRLYADAHFVPTKAPQPDVTYVDLSGPAEPEAEFPVVALKGSL
jgi:hypothetical protein